MFIYSPNILRVCPGSISRDESESEVLREAGQRTLHIGEDNPIRISSGHRILHHDGSARGHTATTTKITVEVTGELTEEGWVVDKGDVTDVIDAWDHRFLVEEGDPLVDAFEASGDGDARYPRSPTNGGGDERLARTTHARRVPGHRLDVSVSVSETGELCATY